MSLDTSKLKPQASKAANNIIEETADQPTSKEYSECYVSFIDILGFKETVKGSCDNQAQLANIVNALNINVQALTQNYITEIAPSTTDFNEKINNFSDSFVVSIPNSGIDSLGLALYSTFHICKELIEAGFASRGGITLGKLYHEERSEKNGHIVFGPALIEAYEFENDRADSPRVILGAKLSQNIETTDIQNRKLKDFFSSHLMRCEDGPEMIDIFAHFKNNAFYKHQDRKINDNALKKIGTRLDEALENTRDHPRLFKKNSFLVKQFNQAVSNESLKIGLKYPAIFAANSKNKKIDTITH